MTPRILIIAGSDSGGGAGIQADIKTVTMLGGHAMTAVTAVTAQNTLGVQAVHPVPTEIVVAQMRSVIEDIGIDAVKIGMIGSAETAHAVADVLTGMYPREGGGPDWVPAFAGTHRSVPIVFDPVMVATSGSILSDAETIAAFERLMALSTIVTPNTPELEALSNHPVTDEITQSGAAEAVMARSGCHAVLAKGGHLILRGETLGTSVAGEPFRYENSSRVFDFLYELDQAGWRERSWGSPRIDTRHTHGTGCTLASAIATGLGEGRDLEDSIGRAIRFVRIALINAPGFGQGNGPIGHTLGLFPFDELKG